MDSRVVTKPEAAVRVEEAQAHTPFPIKQERRPTGRLRARRVVSRRRWSLTPYLFVLPGLVLLAIWVYWPLVQTFWYSFFSGNLSKGIDRFVALENYRTVLTLPEFQKSLANTGIYILGMIPLAVFLPMVIALMLSKVRGSLQTVYRSILFMPVIMAPVVVSLIWLWILNPIQGVLNRTLNFLFGVSNINWLGDAATAIWVIVLITTWKVFGFSLILFLAAIVGIDKEYQEAARIDGATELAVMRYIIFPLITPTFYFLIIYTVLYAGQWAFGPVNVLTQGGPRNSTSTVYFILYQFGFEYFNIGTASAAAVMLFVVLGIGTFMAIRYTDRKAHYEN